MRAALIADARPQANKRPGPGRPRHTIASITLAMPPSVNNAFVNVAGKGRVRSPEYRKWRESAGWAIKAARLGKVPGLFAVTIRAGKPDNRVRDLDNLTKATLDALQAFGVVENDSNATRILCEWSAQVAPGSVAIEVRQFSSPETRLRLSRAHHLARLRTDHHNATENDRGNRI